MTQNQTLLAVFDSGTRYEGNPESQPFPTGCDNDCSTFVFDDGTEV